MNQAFPVNWIWWLTILLATLLVSVTAEFVNYFLRDMREIELVSGVWDCWVAHRERRIVYRSTKP